MIEMEANGQSGPRTFACYEADNPNKELFCNLDTGLCELSQAACPEDADYVCDGDRLNSCGEIAISWDCTSDDILATGCNNGACIGIPEDEACNPPAFLCADGYFCDSDTNTCQEGEAPSAPDAGVLPTENTDGGPSIDDADAGNNETLQADAGTADGATDGTADGTDDGTLTARPMALLMAQPTAPLTAQPTGPTMAQRMV